MSFQSNSDFALIESLRWDGTLHRETMHLARLNRSAQYFHIPVDPFQISKALRSYCQNLSVEQPSKVRTWLHKYIPVITKYNPLKIRILLYQSGELKIEHQPLLQSYYGKVILAEHIVNSSDPYLLHKTTNRQLFNETYKQAQANQFDDALFFNERGELTEGCIHNVFIAKNKKLLTPSVSCGLLPGIYRDYVLSTSNHAKEQILTIEDLKSADAVYICNSVRGIYEVIIDHKNLTQRHGGTETQR